MTVRNKHHSHWAQKLVEAMGCFARVRSIQDSLHSAAMSITGIVPAEIPDSVKEELAEWWAALTAVPGEAGEDPIRATTRTLSNEECEALADQLRGWLYAWTYMEN